MEVLFSGIIKVGSALDPMTLFLIMASTVFGIVIGALPGLTSTMGVALLTSVFGMSRHGLSTLGQFTALPLTLGR